MENKLNEYKKKISFFNIFLFILFLISFFLILYVWIHNKAILQNEDQINQMNKNIYKLEKNCNSIKNNTEKLEKMINDQEKKQEISYDDSKYKNNFFSSDKNIFLASENFVAKDYKKFPKFDELTGLQEPKLVAKNFVNFLKNKKVFQNRGSVSVPKGLIMFGTPGCGKTVFASSIARESEVPFIETSCSIFAQELIGKAPKMVKELFELAREAAHRNGKGAIIFLDECENVFLNIDSLKPGSEIANVVNEFKIQLEPRPEEINSEQPIFVIAATNHIDGLESAILSRFTHKIELIPGNKEERKIQLKDILKKHQFPITIEAKEFLLEIINEGLENLPPHYEKNINGFLVETPNEKNYKKAYRILENLVKEANSQSISREIKNMENKKVCSHPKHEKRFENNKIFYENNKNKQKTDANILENCCECKSINIEDLKIAYQLIIDDKLTSLEKAKKFIK
ncbi:MAG: ATP-binding protein [Candidatus Phytoplasma stylosanthis]|nr:ATP-binding protein [Candidatus Phytoplasma stylosanthis]